MTARWKDRYQHGQSDRVPNWTVVPIENDEDTMLDLAVEQSLSDHRAIIAYTLTEADAVDDKGPQLEIGVWGKAAAGYLVYSERWNGFTERASWISVGQTVSGGTVTYWVDIDRAASIPTWAHLPLDDIRVHSKLFAFHPTRPAGIEWITFPPPTAGRDA